MLEDIELHRDESLQNINLNPEGISENQILLDRLKRYRKSIIFTIISFILSTLITLGFALYFIIHNIPEYNKYMNYVYPYSTAICIYTNNIITAYSCYIVSNGILLSNACYNIQTIYNYTTINNHVNYNGIINNYCETIDNTNCINNILNKYTTNPPFTPCYYETLKPTNIIYFTKPDSDVNINAEINYKYNLGYLCILPLFPLFFMISFLYLKYNKKKILEGRIHFLQH
jgi:hypothetical protein